MDSNGQHSSQDRFSILQSLLNAKDQKDIETLKKELESISSQDFFDKRLDTKIEESSNNPNSKFTEAIGKIVPSSLKSEIKRKPEMIIDSLYPIIGGIVTKYVTESLKDFMDGINEKIETQLFHQQLVTNVKAKLKGQSVEQYMLLQAQKVQVNGILLIEKGSGIIIDNYFDEGFQQLNPDLFSGLLVAIQSFGRDCISDSAKSNLDEISYGGYKVLLESAGSVLLVVIVKGETSRKLMRKVRTALAGIVQSHGDYLQNYDGDHSKIPLDLKKSVSSFVDNKKLDPKRARRVKYIKYCIAFILISILAYAFYSIKSKRNEILKHVSKHYIYRNFSLRFETSSAGFYKLVGTVPSQKDRLNLQLYIDSQFKNTDISYELGLDPLIEPSLRATVKSLIMSLSLRPGISIRAKLERELAFTGYVQDEKTKVFVTKKISMNYSYLTPKINLVIAPEKFYQYIKFIPGQVDAYDDYKKRVSDFVKSPLEHDSFYHITAYNDGQGSKKLNVNLSQKRIEKLKELIKSIDSNSVIKSKISLNASSSFDKMQELGEKSFDEHNFVIIEKHTVLK